MIHLIQFGGHGVQFGLHHGAGFIHQVDGLIGQETVGDIPVGQGGRRNQRAILDFHAVEHLVPFLQATQDGDGVLHAGLIDHDRLETTLQGRVLLDIFTVLIQRGGADAVQLAAGQHGLQQVAGVHGAVRLAGTHDGMQLIDEEDDLAFRLLHFVQNGLQAFLKLAAVLGTGHQRAHIQAEHRAILQVFRHIAADDPLGQTFGDGGLAHTGFTDQHRVVLALTGQDADDIADLGIPADDRVQLVGTGHLHQILAVLFQCVVGGFRVITGHALVAAHGGQLLHEAFRRDVESLEQLTGGFAGALQNAEEYMLHADVFILHLFGLLLRRIEGTVQVAGDVDLFGVTSGAGHPGQRLHLLQGSLGKGVGVRAQLGEQLGDQSLLLLGQRGQHVFLLHRLVGIFHRKALRTLQRLHGLLRQLIHVHKCVPPYCADTRKFIY